MKESRDAKEDLKKKEKKEKEERWFGFDDNRLRCSLLLSLAGTWTRQSVEIRGGGTLALLEFCAF